MAAWIQQGFRLDMALAVAFEVAILRMNRAESVSERGDAVRFNQRLWRVAGQLAPMAPLAEDRDGLADGAATVSRLIQDDAAALNAPSPEYSPAAPRPKGRFVKSWPSGARPAMPPLKRNSAIGWWLGWRALPPPVSPPWPPELVCSISPAAERWPGFAFWSGVFNLARFRCRQ